MTENQNEIYKGLKSIGEEIAQFYFDGVQIVSSDFGTKSYLLAHILREIDGGLRDIFGSKKMAGEFQKQLKDDSLKKLYDEFKEDYKNYDYLKDITYEDFKNEKGHISSIVVSFGSNLEQPEIKRYIKVARWLHKYAHRSGAFNTARDPKDVLTIWGEFEQVLSKLIGNYYAVADRLDSILVKDEPSKETLLALKNLLSKESRYFYFFNKLKSIKWLPHLFDEGYFRGEFNPQPVEDKDNPGQFAIPYWAVLQYLEFVAETNFAEPKNEISSLLVSIFENISGFQKPDGNRVNNVRTDSCLFKIICFLPKGYIKESHLSFIESRIKERNNLIDFQFGKLIDRLIIENDLLLLLKGVQTLLGYSLIENNNFNNVQPVFQNYLIRKILSEHKQKLILICRLPLLEMAISKAQEIVAIDATAFNSYSIPAIEDHQQTSFPDDFECQITYLIRDCLEMLEIGEIIEVVKSLLKNDHPIFIRLAVHTIRVRYADIGSIFWEWKDNPLSETSAKHEIFELLKQTCLTFSKEQIDVVLNWIEKKEYYVPHEYEDNKVLMEKSIAYRKKEWLLAIQDLPDKRISELLEQLNKVNDSIVEHPGFNTWHSGIIGTTSPVTVEQIFQMDLLKLNIYFNQFASEQHDFLGPSVDGLSDAIIQAVRKKPELYNSSCQPLLKSSSLFKYSWIRGLDEAWREEKITFACQDVFKTLLEIVTEESFWKGQNENDLQANWFISSTISFIEHGLLDDRHVFDNNTLPLIKQILLIVLKKDERKVFDYSDLSMTVLNNSKGKIFNALMQFSLRVARIEKKEKDRWDIDIKNLVNELLVSNEENQLLFYVLGQFLPNLNYLDGDWLSENFASIFPLKNKLNLAAGLTGYLFHHRRPNKFFSELFLRHGQFLEVIKDGISLGREARRALVEQICIGYLYDFDQFNLDSKLLKSLVNSKNENIYTCIIFFLWSPGFPFEKKVLPRVKDFWMRVFSSAIELKSPSNDHVILSGTCKWVNSVAEIDEDIFLMLSKSIPYLKPIDRHAVLEGFAKHVSEKPEKVGSLLLNLFQLGVSYEDIWHGKISEMLHILYEKGIKDKANSICLLLGEKGFEQFRDVYNKYNM